MAWLAQSLVDSLRLDENGGEEEDEDEEEREEKQNKRVVAATEAQTNNNANPKQHLNVIENEEGEEDLTEIPLSSTSTAEELQSRGVKEDLTELKQTLTRQLWGVANFLVPPPPPSDPSTPSHSDPKKVKQWDPREELILTEPELERIGSDREQEEEEEEEEFDPVGVTEEVLAFARNIAMHPETWLDFPLDPEDDLDDFQMTTAQQEHAMAIEHLAPRLRALRIELCPCHMSESYFWKVYFVLLHSRLEKHDAEILSTPQVMEARAMWMDELQKQTKAEADWSGINYYHMKEGADMHHEDPFACSPSYIHLGTAFRPFGFEPERSSVALDDEIEKHPIASHETEIVDKAVIQEDPVVEYKDKSLVGMSSKLHVQNFNDDDDDDWPEDDIDLAGYSAPPMSIGLEEDISFSDLEDDDDVCMPIKSKSVVDGPERIDS